MKTKIWILFLVLLTCALSSFVYAQDAGRIIVPASSIARLEDAGVRAHTNYLIYARDGIHPNSNTPTGETPASLACVYKTVSNPIPGCPKNGTTQNADGGTGIIAIVDAFDYPTAKQDLKTFSQTFGLPVPNFKVVFASGTRPQNDCNWSVEMSLDVQWAHAMAPKAIIVLVEAATNSTTDLLTAVRKANQIIRAHGAKGQVSMSWQGSETANQGTLDRNFAEPGVVYFASSGDSGGVVGWPSTSAAIVSAGGTRVNRDGSGNFTNETGWNGSGGGDSAFTPRPSFQDPITSIVGTKRGTPDFSYDADPSSGVSVFNTNPACGNLKWLVVGGTSVSSPALAGLVNLAGNFSTSSVNENTMVYSGLGDATRFNDILTGTAGSHHAGPGWDFVTGVGTPNGLIGK